MKNLTINARVKDDYLGKGTIVKLIKGVNNSVFAFMVKFDETPPAEYNGGSNPCLIWADDLVVINKP